MRCIAGALFVFFIFSFTPIAAQSPQYRRSTPAQEECPQGRQIRAQKSYPSLMTDCEVLDADTAAENQKLQRKPGTGPIAQQPAKPAAPKPAAVVSAAPAVPAPAQSVAPPPQPDRPAVANTSPIREDYEGRIVGN